MDSIIESIINGQRKQAVAQLDEEGILFDKLLEELIDLEMFDEIPKMFRVALNVGYINHK